jgi:FkbM family methyltransferase
VRWRWFDKAWSTASRLGGIEGTWIDVGAHEGEVTLACARQNPRLRVYAFEPNLRLAATLIGVASNFFVVPMAVAEKDGLTEFHLNAFRAASSLLPFNDERKKQWIGGEILKVTSTVAVPTIRLDTFMDLTRIDRVDFLKIDTQGMDLSVVKSAGARLRDITRLTLEVDLTDPPLYEGAPSKELVVKFLQERGFDMESAEKQTYGQEENLTFVRRT